MKDPAGKPAPAGGFKTGGWYSGYQYWNGSFAPQAGMIHPSSNQQGAGSMVSSEVNRQSDAAQGLKPGTIDAYVAKQNQTIVQPQQTGNYDTGAGYSLADSGSGEAFNLGAMGNGEGTPALNLPDLYKNLQASSGVQDLEKMISEKTARYNEAQAQINDNPYLSEASRVGRIQKLTMDFNNNIKNDQDALVMKKQDIQTQLDLATKQFDINSQTAKFALDEFNMLLSSGALAGASGNDIAAITKATGISSSMIKSAINAQRQKDITTSVSTVDDGTNIYSVVINSKTGQIISKQAISASKPEKSSGSGSKSMSTSEALQIMTPAITSVLNSYGDISPSDWQKAKAAWLGQGLTAQSFIDNFGGYADTNRGDFQSAYGFANPAEN